MRWTSGAEVDALHTWERLPAGGVIARGECAAEQLLEKGVCVLGGVGALAGCGGVGAGTLACAGSATLSEDRLLRLYRSLETSHVRCD